jgi:hypothetical protein
VERLGDLIPEYVKKLDQVTRNEGLRGIYTLNKLQKLPLNLANITLSVQK